MKAESLVSLHQLEASLKAEKPNYMIHEPSFYEKIPVVVGVSYIMKLIHMV